MVGITSSEFKILRYIELNGPSTAYDMSKKKGEPPPVGSDKTAYTLLPRLVKNGFLTVVTKKIKTRLKKEYSLTVLGLSLVLDRTEPEECRHIIDRWAELVPLVTGKWSLFIKGGVEDRALRMLKIAASCVLDDVFHGPRDLGQSRDFVERFSREFYNPYHQYFTPEEDSRWIDACAQDSAVHDYLDGKLAMIIGKHEIMVDHAADMRKMLQGKDKKKKIDPRKR